MRPPDLAGSLWADFARVQVMLGDVDSWDPTGSQWDGAEFDQGLWGEGYLTPASWLDVTRDVMSLDVDTGRNGIDDPGDVGTASLTLYDPTGAYAIAGAEKSAIGNLLTVRVEHVASGSSRMVFYGRVTDATAVGDLGAPTTALKAVDLVGALLATDDTTGLAAQGVSDRITDLLARSGLPGELRDIADDPTKLLAVDQPGSRLDAARGAAASSVGGSIWATGAGTITYRFGTFEIDPSQPADYAIGTRAGFVCPAALDLTEKGSDVLNVYDWTTSDRDTPLNATATDSASVRRFGRGASVRTDLLNADATELANLVNEEIARTAWAPERVDNCEIAVGDDASAALVLAQIGELVDLAYTGSAPWTARQLIGSYAHHVSPDGWTIDLKCFPATIGSKWDVAAWDVDSWAYLGPTLAA